MRGAVQNLDCPQFKGDPMYENTERDALEKMGYLEIPQGH